MTKEQFMRHVLTIRDDLVDHLCAFCVEEGFTSEEAMSAVGLLLSDMVASLSLNEAAIVRNMDGLKEAAVTQYLRRSFAQEQDYDS